MLKYIFASHGELAIALKHTLEMFLGEREDIECFSMTKNKSGDEAEREIRALLEKNQGNELIVCTDLLGGSVNNIFTALLMEGFAFELIAGMNVPLLISLLTAYTEGSSDSIGAFVSEAQHGIVHINNMLNERREEDDSTISY